MPETDAQIPAEGGKTVTITIAEVGTDPVEPGSDNEFVIANGKYKLTITIAE